MPTLNNPFQGRGRHDRAGGNVPRNMGADYRRIVGDYLREAREGLGLTQQDVADAVDVRNTAISAVEQGRLNLLPDRYALMVEVLKLDRAKFAKFLLRYTNPWLYALTYGADSPQLRADLEAAQPKPSKARKRAS